GLKMETSQYLDVFIDESTEHMDTLYEQLLELEKQPNEKSIIEEIFSEAHMLKSMSATICINYLAQLTHKFDNVYKDNSYNKIEVKNEMMNYLLHAVYALNEMVEDISNSGNGKKDVKDIVSLLNLIEQGESLDKFEQPPTHASNNDENNPVIKVDEFQLTILGESQEQGFEQYEISVHLSEDCLLKGARVYMIFELLEKMGEVVQTDPAVQDLEEEKFDNSFKIMYISKTSMEEIQQKLMKVSEVASIEVVPFVLDAYKKQAKTKNTT